MTKEALIGKMIKMLTRLPRKKISEVANFAEDLLRKYEDQTLRDGIGKLTAESKVFEYLRDEEDLYTVNDLKECYG